MSRAHERATGRRRPLRPRPERVTLIVVGGIEGDGWALQRVGKGHVLQVGIALERRARELWPALPVERHAAWDREAWNREQHDRSR